MQNKTFDIILDIKNKSEKLNINCVQNDKQSTEFNITLVDDELKYNIQDSKLEIAFKKPDNTVVVQDANYNGSYVNVVLHEQVLTAPGRVVGEVRVLENEAILTSTQFEFIVTSNILNDETIKSTSEYSALDELVLEAKEMQIKLEQATKEIENAGKIKEEIEKANERLNQTIKELDEKLESIGPTLDNVLQNKEALEQAVIESQKVIEEFKLLDIKGLKELVSKADALNTSLSKLLETITKAENTDKTLNLSITKADTLNKSLDENITSATKVDGDIKTKMDKVQEWIDDPEQLRGPQGPPGDPATNLVKSVNSKTGEVIITKSDVGLSAVNNVAITAAQVIKINELNYTRALTQAQYDALSTAEKNRTDVWYGTYKE